MEDFIRDPHAMEEIFGHNPRFILLSAARM